jgi:hypothetical protein
MCLFSLDLQLQVLRCSADPVSIAKGCLSVLCVDLEPTVCFPVLGVRVLNVLAMQIDLLCLLPTFCVGHRPAYTPRTPSTAARLWMLLSVAVDALVPARDLLLSLLVDAACASLVLNSLTRGRLTCS